MPRTILVPIDLAQKESGLGALAFARELADGGKGAITLLNVQSRIPEYAAAQIPDDIMENYDKVALGDLHNLARDHGEGLDIRTVVRSGHPAREIVAHAEETKTDVIVMASHDPGWEDYLLGSVAANVVRHAHCSVLVVRNRPE